MTHFPSTTTWIPSSSPMPSFRELFDWLAHDPSRPSSLPRLPDSICLVAAECMARQIGIGNNSHPVCSLDGYSLTVTLGDEIRQVGIDHLSRSVWNLCRRHPSGNVEYLIGRIAYSWEQGTPSFDDLTEEELLMWLNAALYVLRSDEEISL